MKNIKIIIPLLLLVGCTAPTVQLEEQRIVANIDKESSLNKTFLKESDHKVYIYVENRIVTTDASNKTELPSGYTTLIRSLLSDFKRNKVEVIIEEKTYKDYLKDKNKRAYTYQVSGALTQYDKDVLSQSSSFRLGINFGRGEGETDLDEDYSNSNSNSVLAVDLFLLQEGSIVEKSSSKVIIQSENKANNFAIMLNGGQIGYRARTQVKDGLDSSIRKMFAVSLRDLLSKAIRQESVL